VEAQGGAVEPGDILAAEVAGHSHDELRWQAEQRFVSRRKGESRCQRDFADDVADLLSQLGHQQCAWLMQRLLQVLEGVDRGQGGLMWIKFN